MGNELSARGKSGRQLPMRGKAGRAPGAYMGACCLRPSPPSPDAPCLLFSRAARRRGENEDLRSECLRAPRMEWNRVLESPTAANRRESSILLCEDDVNDDEVGVGEPIVLDSVSPRVCGRSRRTLPVPRPRRIGELLLSVSLHVPPSDDSAGASRRREARSPTLKNVALSILPTSWRRCPRARGILGLRGRN